MTAPSAKCPRCGFPLRDKPNANLVLCMGCGYPHGLSATQTREQRAAGTRAAGMEPCERCGLPAEPATDYCGGCWAQVHRDRAAIGALIGEVNDG